MPARIATPATEAEVAEILAWANSAGASVTVRGGGTKQTWSNLPGRLDLVLSTTKLNRVIDHAYEDQTVTVQAGCTIAALQSKLAEHGQRLALDVLWPDKATVGGVIAANDSGALRFRYGSVRDLLLGVTTVLPNGTIARSGGKVVKNVAGYDLPKLLTGSMGTLGVITEATFRVHPLPRETRTLSFIFPDLIKANRLIVDIMGSTLVPGAMQLRCGTSSTPQVDILLEGISAGIDAQTEGCIAHAAAGKQIEASADVWRRRERLFGTEGLAAVLKLSSLPSNLHGACGTIGNAFGDFAVIAQATGLGLARVQGSSADELEFRVNMNSLATAFRDNHGQLTLLSLPTHLKRGNDVFGPKPDSHPLMIRIKQQFDPNGILNPGRFLGGI